MDLPKYIKNLSRFINDFCAISDGNEFLTLFKNTYPKELNLKAEHEGNHISILDLDSKIKDMVFVNKILTKETKSPFFTVRIPNLSSNISSAISYGSKVLELPRIARCTLRINVIPKESDLFSRIIAQDGNKALK